MQPSTLTMKGISTVIESRSTPTILQVINLQHEIKDLDKGKSFTSELSDGYTKLKCYWGGALFDKIHTIKDKFNGCIVVLTEYVATNKKVLVTSFDMIYLYDEIIGDPVSYKDYLSNQKSEFATNVIDLTKAIKFTQDMIPASKPSQKVETPIIKMTVEKENNSSNKNYTPVEFKLKNRQNIEYQTIEDLYPTLEGWTLYCRITKLSFREFENKKKQMTQLLEFEIRDKNDWVCKGNIFGEYAKRMSENLKEGEVYTFSRGYIKMDTYKTPSHDKDSPYSITFNEQSQIILSTNDDSIKNSQDTLRSISDIQNWKIGGEIDIACIIKQVRPETTYSGKNNTQTYVKKIFIVCDPISKMEAEVSLWRDKVNMVDSSFERRPVILQGFKVNQYNDKLSLSGTVKSRILNLSSREHPLNHVDIGNSMNQFQNISYQKKEGAGDQKQNLTTIKELMAESDRLRDKEVLWSTFRVYINRIKDKGKKWYSGCPSQQCKKAIEEDAIRCPHCNVPVPKPTFRYVLSVQLSDAIGTGYVWATAYDDFANKVLSLQSSLPAEIARRYSDEDFLNITKKCLFQEFKISMKTNLQYTPDQNRRIKHSITSFTMVNPAKEAQNNLEKIKSIMA